MTVLCAHFMPEIGYQEVDLASAFARLQADVSVISSCLVSPGSRKIRSQPYQAGHSQFGKVNLIRVPHRLSFGPNVVSAPLDAALRATNPDICILIGPGKLFGLSAYCDASFARRVSIFQENSEDGRSKQAQNWRALPQQVMHRFLKRPAYSRVINASDRVVCNVPETQSILQPWLTRSASQALDERGVNLRLGFDPTKFRFDPEQRNRLREAWGVGQHELLIGTCTRATRGKNLEQVLEQLSHIRQQGYPIKYALAGVMDDEYGRQLRNYVQAISQGEFVRLLPVLAHAEMSGFYSAADLGVWPQAAITIQQAMGTGLPIILKNRRSVSHLLEHGVNGWYVDEQQSWQSAVIPAVASLLALSPAERDAVRQTTIVRNTAYLSYDKVALEMVAGLE